MWKATAAIVYEVGFEEDFTWCPAVVCATREIYECYALMSSVVWPLVCHLGTPCLGRSVRNSIILTRISILDSLDFLSRLYLP